MRNLALLNPSNYCYSNSALLAILWARHSGSPSCEILGEHLQIIWEWLRKQARPVTPWNHLTWRTAHVGWQRPNIQHDVGEYLNFLRARIHPSAVGQWESRLSYSEQPARCIDEGTTWPIFFQEPLAGQALSCNTAISLQSLLDAWTHQEGEHALVRVPAVLCLQVNRFAIGSEAPGKSTQPVTPTQSLFMPRFCNDLLGDDALQQSFVQYRRTAMILHIGPRCTEGHYRCVMFQQHSDQALITDDDRPATLLTAQQFDACCRQSYVFFYARSEADPS